MLAPDPGRLELTNLDTAWIVEIGNPQDARSLVSFVVFCCAVVKYLRIPLTGRAISNLSLPFPT